MQLTTAPALLLGLSLRLFTDKFISPRESPTVQDILLVGAWQGVALVFAFANNQELAICFAFLAGMKLLLDFYTANDPMTPTCTFLGLALGVATTVVLSRLLDDLLAPPRSVSRKSSTALRRERIVQFRRNLDGPDGARERERVLRQTYSDITSLDSTSSPLPPHAPRTPREREVAALRARASLADSERRRCREERKWAIAQGNHARADQMAGQAKRYSALMQSFHREADAIVVEASNEKAPQPHYPQSTHPAPKGSRVERAERPHPTALERRQRTTSQTKQIPRPNMPDKVPRGAPDRPTVIQHRSSNSDPHSRHVSVDISRRERQAVHVQVK